MLEFIGTQDSIRALPGSFMPSDRASSSTFAILMSLLSRLIGTFRRYLTSGISREPIFSAASLSSFDATRPIMQWSMSDSVQADSQRAMSSSFSRASMLCSYAEVVM
ncbi:MAG: hypothetical protein IKQ60_06235 [Candidatus Methanomethylophilaceae archaeon]|nr:hypothetical protein [Candidatus Methanomethylophilaceae archaeon]